MFPHRLCYLIIDDLDREPTARQGTLVILYGVTPSRRSRQQAIELARTLWEDDRLPAERFATGITEESIMSLSEMADAPDPNLLPVEQGAIELCQLLACQVAHQHACTEARPLVSLVQAVLDEERSLTPTELDLASDRKTGKILQKVASTCADLTRFRDSMSGNARLVLEIIRADGAGEPEIVTIDEVIDSIESDPDPTIDVNPPKSTATKRGS
ncbi:MAG: hypothetical protein HC795_14465 [Coleofasciculaceae cyanobacterium RL_1_1]|nr:hypothetical protein [Coleofasciculaceae cyanobacterium RL_1_1]